MEITIFQIAQSLMKRQWMIKDFICKTRLCFNCRRKGHTARDCLENLQCIQCSSKHHDFVHYDRPEQSDTYI